MVEQWMSAHGRLLGWTTGPRLVDCWFVPEDAMLVVVLDGPDESSFEPLVQSTAVALNVPAEAVELRSVVPARGTWPFRGEPAVADPSRRDPHPTRWQWIDIGPDDRTLRIMYMHGIPNGLHHVEVYEDDEEVRVTVYLGLNHDWRGGGYVLIGITEWVTATTAQPVAHRYMNDGADSP